MGKKKSVGLLFLITILGGISGWATYNIIINGLQDFMQFLASIKILGLNFKFLENFYVQNIIIVFGALILLWILTGWHLKKLIREILD